MNTTKAAAAKLGAIGGRAGTGKAKRRSKEHYARISALGVAAKKRKKENKILHGGPIYPMITVQDVEKMTL